LLTGRQSAGSASAMSYSQPARLEFFMDFLGIRANAELADKIYVALHTSQTVFLKLTPNISLNCSPPDVIKIPS
jgi:hypothetical protein